MPAMMDLKDLKLMRWYDKHDIICPRLCIRTPESGLRGVFAAEDIPAFEGIAVIPPHMIIRSPFKDMVEIVQARKAELVSKYYCRNSLFLAETWTAS